MTSLSRRFNARLTQGVVVALLLAASTSSAATVQRSDGLPEGRYALQWKTVSTEGAKVGVTIREGSKKTSAQGGRFEAEFSVRGRKLSGCVLTDMERRKPVLAKCSMQKGRLRIELGKDSSGVTGLRFDLARSSDRLFAGDAIMVSPLLPGGRAVFGSVTMAPLG